MFVTKFLSQSVEDEGFQKDPADKGTPVQVPCSQWWYQLWWAAVKQPSSHTTKIKCMGALFGVPGLDWGFAINWRTHHQNETADEGFHFDTCSVIVFYLAWLNCNTFSVHTFLGVACGEGRQIYFFLALFSVLMSFVLKWVWSRLCIASIFWKWERITLPVFWTSWSCVNVGSVLPWEDLFAWMWCSTSWPDSFQPVQNQGR